MGGRPPTEAVLKDSKGQKLEKLCGQSEWQPRFVCVTADKFLILHSESDTDISDQIPLVSFTREARVCFVVVVGMQTCWEVMVHKTPCCAFLTCFLPQHEITSSDRTSDGPAEALIWLINTVENGYNNGRQVG